MRILIWLVCVLLLSLLPIAIHIMFLLRAGQPVLMASEVGSPDFVLVGVVISADAIGRLCNRIRRGLSETQSGPILLALLFQLVLALFGVGAYVVFRAGSDHVSINPVLLWVVVIYFVCAIAGAVGAILIEERTV